MLIKLLHYFNILANPKRFIEITGKVLPFIFITSVVMLILGLYLAVYAPSDYQQGKLVMIMYIHVPAAWLSLAIYSVMIFFSFTALVWNYPLAFIIVRSSAFIGAIFTIVCLCTGSIWGKPAWNAWWVWDARLTSMLILLFIYLGIILIFANYNNKGSCKAGAIFVLVGAVNLPIIKFSVDWWNTLHQSAGIIQMGGSSIDSAMLIPLIINFLAFLLYYKAILFMSVTRYLLHNKILFIYSNLNN